jgi:hypothetical protein
MSDSNLTAQDLRARVLDSLKDQGFELARDGLIRPDGWDKQAIRDLHAQALHASIERAREGLERHEARLLGYIADGSALDPTSISPVLREVQPGSEDELLFRYARLHWSIPISAGYGRRLRFLVFDRQNGKLIGLFGLGDPVFAMGPRDRWIGWDRETRSERLRFVMDAFVVGAVPPYSQLLCGKLVAMLLASGEVARAFKKKYSGTRALISGRPLDGRLALVTTSSALGRSALYNRLRLHDRKLYVSVGFSLGSGEFHFSNGVYADLLKFARSARVPTAKHERWGAGWRSRREVVRAVLPHLGLSRELLYHGVKRELFVVPLARNTREFLRGTHARLQTYDVAAEDIFEWFRGRWLLPRARWDTSFREFSSASYRLWLDTEG